MPEIARYIDAEIERHDADPQHRDIAAYEAVITEIAVTATHKVLAGMRRLPPDQLRLFFAISPQLLAVMPADVCAGMANSSLSASEMQRSIAPALPASDGTKPWSITILLKYLPARSG